MRRLNPKTGKPFRCGDIGENGKIFKSYTPQNKLSAEGYYYEHWQDEKTFYRNETKRKLNSKKRALTPKGRAMYMLKNCKQSFKERNIFFDLVLEDILPAVEAGHCELTGLPFDFKPSKEKAKNPYAPSVDRIDSDKGYTRDNVRVVLWAVNQALGECSDEEIIPILKALVNALEKNVKKKPATPVSEGAYIQGAVGAELGSVSTPWTWEDSDHSDDYSGATRGENTYRSTKEGSGNSLGRRVQKVATLSPVTRIEDHGESDAEVIRLEFGRRHLSD